MRKSRRIIHARIRACIILPLLAPLAATGREPGAPLTYPPGISLGSPVGINVPRGFTFQVVTSYYDSRPTYAEGSDKTPQQTAVGSVAPRLFWTAPWTVLGATEMAYIVQPIVTVDSVNVPRHPEGRRYSTTGLGNTIIFPVNLSWDLGRGWHMAVMFGFLPPTGTYDKNATLNTGANFWTYEPEFAVSYLANGWNLTVHAIYQTNTTNQATGYRSGDMGLLDLTVTKKLGRWEAGVVSYYDKQVTADDNHGTHYPSTIRQSRPEQWAAGLLVGYKFGPVNLQAYATQDFLARNGGAKGGRYWLRLVAPLHD